MSAYSMTSGSGRVLEALERALATGVRCTILVNKFDEQQASIQSFLLRLASEYPGHACVYDIPSDNGADGLHAKIMVADRAVALVGSANLSARGLVTAHELAVVIRGHSAEIIASVVDRLLGGAGAIRRYPSQPGSSSL
jgi:phosphatidylserine/phosphatidylglycerophosphate/cardiolipin synthase-like enzyme